MATVAIDARDAFAAPLRGWGRYALELVRALPVTDGVRYRIIEQGGRGPEIFFEQVGLPALLRRERPGLVHAPNCFLPLRRPCPGVVTVHDLAFEAFPRDFSRRTGLKYRTITPRAARSAQRVICVSDSTARDVVARYGVDEAAVRVIPNGPSLAVGDAPPGVEGVPELREMTAPYLLAIGDLRPKKNLRRLVRAFAALRAEGLRHHLVLAGADGGEAPSLSREAGGAPVHVTGYLPDAQLDALLRGADALVHPSLYEGFGLVVVEAMARGVPVVAARATALPETGGDAAAYFDPLDVDDMAATIARVIGDRELHADLADRGRVRAAQFSWERTARETLAVYRELL